MTRDLVIADGENAVIYSTEIEDLFRIQTDTVELTTNWSVVYSGTPFSGEKRTIRYEAKNITTAVAATILVLGASIPSEYWDKQWTAICTYNGKLWEVQFTPDFDETDIIITDQIKALNVTTAKINDLAITTGKLADASVTDPKLAVDAVTNTKIIANAVSLDKLATQAANTVLANATAGVAVPTALVIGASQFLARLKTGDLKACTVAEIRTLLACLTTTLSSGTILIGDGTNVATERTLTGPVTVDNTGATAIGNSVIEVNNLGHTTSANRIMGPLAVKFLDGADLKALLDSTTNDLFQMTTGDCILSVMVVTQTPHGVAATIDVGADATLRTAGANANGFIEAANAGAAGKYSSDNATYSGPLLDFGQFTVDATGYITVASSVDISAGAFVGFAMVTYIPV